MIIRLNYVEMEILKLYILTLSRPTTYALELLNIEV